MANGVYLVWLTVDGRWPMENSEKQVNLNHYFIT